MSLGDIKKQTALRGRSCPTIYLLKVRRFGIKPPIQERLVGDVVTQFLGTAIEPYPGMRNSEYILTL